MALRRAAAALLIAVLPLAAAETLARSAGGSLTRSLPSVSDEVAYWNQIATFAEAGFHGGYTTINERPARASFSHFGPNGPVFSALYGLPGRVAGWGYTSGPLFGAVVFAAGAFLWAWLARPPAWQASLLLLTFWPVLLAAPNTMQESLHLAVGCLLAALLPPLLAPATANRAGRLFAVALVVAVASLVRPVWGLCAIGVGWQMARARGSRTGVEGLFAGGLLCAALYVAFNALAAPYPTASGGLDLLSRAPTASAALLLRAVADTAGRWLEADIEPLERLFRLEVLFVAALCTWSAWRGTADRRTAAAMALTLWLVILANFALRNTGSWQDYRTATPVLLMAILTAVSAKQRWPWAVVAVHLLAAPLGVATFQDFHAARFATDRTPAIARFATEVGRFIRFDPQLSGWGNTVLVSAERYDTPLMGLPRGMGISAVFDWSAVELPLRSRYLLLTDVEAAVLRPRVPLRALGETPLGMLYENEQWSR